MSAEKSKKSGKSGKPVKSGKSGTIGQIIALLMERKAWWLVPMITVFLLLGALIFFTSGSAVAPFIYTLF